MSWERAFLVAALAVCGSVMVLGPFLLIFD